MDRCDSCISTCSYRNGEVCPYQKSARSQQSAEPDKHYPNHKQDREDWLHAEMHPFDTPPWTNYPPQSYWSRR